MLIKRNWTKYNTSGNVMAIYRGWFLFGIIPLYIKVVK